MAACKVVNKPNMKEAAKRNREASKISYEELTISEINTLKIPLLYAKGLTPNGKLIEFVPVAALDRI